MSSIDPYILLGFLIFLLVAFTTLHKLLIHEPEQEEIEIKGKQPNPPSKHNLLDSLEFMRDRNIITTQEFNQLFVKTLPYIEGKKAK